MLDCCRLIVCSGSSPHSCCETRYTSTRQGEGRVMILSPDQGDYTTVLLRAAVDRDSCFLLPLA